MRQSGGRSAMKIKKLNEAEKAMLLLNTLVNVLKDNGANIEDGFIDIVDDKGNDFFKQIKPVCVSGDCK